MRGGVTLGTAILAAVALAACDRAPRAADGAGAPEEAADVELAPVLAPEAALASFRLPDGYRIELVAAEPLVQDPVAIDFDPDGRVWVAEMRGYMPNLAGEGEDAPVGRVVVLEDTDDDGRLDRRTVFLDSLVLPRAVRVLERGVLVGAPPDLWLARDTTGDLRADVRELVRDDYGTRDSNPEHNANGLLWGLDNWIHSANYAGQLRARPDGGFAHRPVRPAGQWGVSSDEVGRLYRNFNEDPLRADLVPAHYAARSERLRATRGVYEALTPNVPVWPAHPTPAVNRGYRPQTLRADSTLAHYTAAGAPTAYVGDRLPAELRRSVFVTEPAGNLVGRFDVREAEDGTLAARPAYARTEFLASTDERFRPVNLATAPDGTLWVVDMYRGIIQHRTYITGYLEQRIRDRGLEQPVGLGRLYRVVHASSPPGPRPRLSRASTAELVPLLAHPNGWWRTTAQRMLVERGDRSAVPALAALARSAPDERARLHALWTLDGLGAADAAIVTAALGDGSRHVRAAAVRLAEPWLARPGHPLAAAVERLAADGDPVVRRQLAASLGELPPAARERAIAAVAARHGDDPVVADLVAGALAGREAPFAERLLAAGEARPATLRALAGSAMRGRDAGAVARLLGWSGEAARPPALRDALLAGLADGARGRPAVAGDSLLALPRRPAALLAVAAAGDSARAARAGAVAAALTWPGKPAPERPVVPPLSADEAARFAAGERAYAGSCAGCHGADGRGVAGAALPLAGSAWATGPASRLVRIVEHGKEGQMLMPPVGAAMTDAQLAAVLTYVRRAWGNAASPVDAGQVREVRGATAGRARPWTEAELARVPG